VVPYFYFNPTDYTNLVWSDEFNVDGAPDTTKWNYDLGNNSGWGNSELQYYTNSPNNVIVQGGSLKITAKSETISGFNYSSARLKTQGKKDFTYGKVECRAKLPVGSGTWPAIWMLGSNITSVNWPACGEIDIMEHKGNSPGIIYGTLHYPGRSGGNGNSNSTLANTSVSNDFHIYKTIWSPTSIRIYVDNNLFHTVANTGSLPFNSNFFMLLNVAMGGTFGGNIAPGFTQSAMEVDYIRLYQ
jgi:beta-glucanase (GH16 family)